MSYYNSVYVIFQNGDGLDWRFAGQMLPAGAIPIAVANSYKDKITEIINEFKPETIIDFVNEIIQKKYAPKTIKLSNWEYIHS
jgi:hypothetical protein